jgi:predicted small metal-binding protein
MAKIYVLNCGEVSNIDCDFETRGGDLEEVMRHCAEHATKEHGAKSFPPRSTLKCAHV